ncbi:Sir2 family NAD-dependent protein deacetylase [Vibrio parahaemolyticus]|uniref:protein acetyllysine N-acetyltransferase n=1 Tax=Vibrio parahaemolyticus TaxID=670 RepID=A0AAW8PXP1_VIBPH|nr:Sir2 family NAD-dependent protein deacetylase [Vibrio parahaemolyticus]EGR2229320.1 NAD-dependent deacylase [Vibrio parahaemolyticus]MDS1820717.1 Sir2 family NAD-dependent protein deacetylase [Vibrio parahaemolyticus]
MAKPEVNHRKIVVFTGAGISLAAGIPTFRFGEDALWANHKVSEVATASALRKNPEAVISFFNDRKADILQAEPTQAHIAIANLEEKYEVVVITTNLDNLHEKAGSTNVIHVHGNIMNARSAVDSSLVYPMGDKPICIGDLCEHGAQLRPDVVLFDENVELKSVAQKELKDAGKVVIIGSSLSVKPICNIFKAARGRADKYLVAPDRIKPPYGFKPIYAKAEEYIPRLCKRWMEI